MLSRKALGIVIMWVMISASLFSFPGHVAAEDDSLTGVPGHADTADVSSSHSMDVTSSEGVDSDTASEGATPAVEKRHTVIFSSNKELEERLRSEGVTLDDIIAATQSQAEDVPTDPTDSFHQSSHSLTPSSTTGGTRALLTADTLIVLDLPDSIHYGENLTVRGGLYEIPSNTSNPYGYVPVPWGQVTIAYPNNLPLDKQEYKVRANQYGVFEKEMQTAVYPFGYVDVRVNFSGHWYNPQPSIQDIQYWLQQQMPTVAYYKEWNPGGLQQVRTGCEALDKVKLIHDTEIVNLVASPSKVTVGGTVKVTGTLKDKDTGMPISGGIVELFLDGTPFPAAAANSAVTSAGTFEFSGDSMVIPMDAFAGVHTFTVYFKQVKQTAQNTNLTDSHATASLKVSRLTEVLFEDRLEDGEQVYRNTEVYINGSVVDNTGSPPKLAIGSESFTYEVEIQWGGQTIGTTELTSAGKFSLKYLIPPTQDLTVVTIHIVFKPGQNAYYEGSETDGYWKVMSRPHIDLSIEKYATRGSTFTIKGYLRDDLNKGIEGYLVFIRWGSDENRIEKETGSDGMFEATYNIPTSHPLGPTYVIVTFEGVKDKYDPATSPGPPSDAGLVYVVSGTWIYAEGGTGIKGDTININGRLYDDQNKSVAYKTIVFIWHKDEDDRKGIVKAYQRTGDGGTFSFKFTVDEFQPVGEAWAELRFNGTPTDAYTDGDAYFGWNDVERNFEPLKKLYPDESLRGSIGRGTAQFTIYARTMIRITAPSSKVLRNDTITINVELREKIGNIIGDPIPSQSISLMIGTMSTTPRKTSAQGIAKFSVVLPPYLDEGKTKVKALYNSSKTSYYLPSENTTIITVRARTVFVVDQQPTEIEEGRMATWQLRLIEADSSTGDVVPRAQVSITYRSVELRYEKTINGTTSDYGRIIFNETWDYIRKGSTLEVTITFAGDDSRYLEPANITLGPYDMKKKEVVNPTQSAMETYLPYILVGVIVVIILVALYFWIQKRRKVSAMKRIISRARDKLIAGDPYKQTIFLAYQQLVQHLRRYGYLRRQGETFREFEDAIKNALPIDENAMREFINVIEEARYSNHPIGPEHRDKAINTLSAIEASLAAIEANPEMALKVGEVSEEEAAPEVEIVLSPEEAGETGVPPSPPGQGVPPGQPPAGGVPPAPPQKAVPPAGEKKGLPPKGGEVAPPPGSGGMPQGKPGGKPPEKK